MEIWSNGDDSDGLGDIGWPRQKLGWNRVKKRSFSLHVFTLKSAPEFYFTIKMSSKKAKL